MKICPCGLQIFFFSSVKVENFIDFFFFIYIFNVFAQNILCLDKK